MVSALEPVFKENHCQIWTGDFNALTREDYTDEKWNHITGVRKQNGWELPKTELTTQVSTGCGSHFENPTNFKILKEPLLVQKQILHQQKALNLSYLEPERQCQGLKKVP